jgi:protein-L-isoaspartate O-methyltransferase
MNPQINLQISSQTDSVSASYFEALYQARPDPWGYETSEYEQQKYAATIAALPRNHYHSVLEIGGSIGVLTAQLAPYCDSLLSIDSSATAQTRAKARCRDLPQVEFQTIQVPTEFPAGKFDLIIISEVGYYLCHADLSQLRQQVIDALQLKGHLLLVHWLDQATDFRQTGDQVHDCFLAEPVFQSKLSQRSHSYRIDVLEHLPSNLTPV